MLNGLFEVEDDGDLYIIYMNMMDFYKQKIERENKRKKKQQQQQKKGQQTKFYFQRFADLLSNQLI